MKKIVRGNDCTLRIPVMKIVGGEQVAFALPACTDIAVNLVSMVRRYSLEFSIDTAEDNVILAKVEGESMPLSKMALEVKGKIFGLDWRSNEYEQIEFVNNNASGDTSFGDVEEGEQSVEMDTAIVVLAPSADLTLLIKQSEEAIAASKAETETATQAEASRAAAETSRVSAEQGRVGAEAARVSTESTRESREAERQAAEASRTSAEDARANAEAARAESESERVSAETDRATAEAARDKAENTRTATEVEREANEQTRKSNETSRKSAESGRVTAESARVKAETGRVSAENARVAAETKREAAETNREKAVDEAVAKAKVSVNYLPDTGEIAITTGE